MSNMPHEPDWREVHREADSSAATIAWILGMLLLLLPLLLIGGGIILFSAL